MLFINGLKFKSFSDFDNMFKAIDLQSSYSRLYIATLVYDKVILERDPVRCHEVNAWIDGFWFPTRYIHQSSDNSDNIANSDYEEDSVGDIID